MHTCRNLMIAWMAVLILGLAACGGSSLRVETPTEKQKARVETAIGNASTKVLELNNNSSDEDFKAAEMAVSAAKQALADASKLSASERTERENRIKRLDARIADARKNTADAREMRGLQMAEEARRLTAAMSGDPITGIRAVLTHGAAPNMSGTVPGSPATEVSGLETAAAVGASTVDGWQRGLYAAREGETADTVTLYTNIDPPGSRPFSGENGKYSAANGLDDDGNLPIADTTDTTLIVSSEFPGGPGLRRHEPGAAGTVLVPGSFDSAPGTFTCTPTEESPCLSSIKAGGGYALTGGSGWKFMPEKAALVQKPDSEYQYFGLWLRETGGVYAIGAFHGGAGAAADEFAHLAALQGRAAYRGPAAGKFAIQRPPGETEAGDFTATVELRVDFKDDTAPGTVEGTVNSFMVEGQAKDWSVALGSAAIGTHGTIASGGTDTARTRWTIAGIKAETTATWSGQFHEADLDRTPTVAIGKFAATHGTTGRMTGAFGTTRQR